LPTPTPPPSSRARCPSAGGAGASPPPPLGSLDRYRVTRAEKLYLELAASRSLPSDADIERLCDLTEPRRDPWVRAELVPA
ncbi:hypothetical protein, partial [Nocardia gipuzkoensis]|uniref:hypothetical protein n=1 Tax=Nocardia gipuzkoensis TaxID=2749991 RepID=UPI0024568E29